jgi:hypothetical protein
MQNKYEGKYLLKPVLPVKLNFQKTVFQKGKQVRVTQRHPLECHVLFEWPLIAKKK